MVFYISFLSAFSTDSAGKLDVLWHDGHALGVDGAKVGVLKETDEVSLRRLLEGHDGRALKPEVSLEILGNLTDKTLEWQLADEKLGRFLVSPDLTESNGAWPVTMGLLDTPCGRGRLAGSLSCQLLPWGFATGRFTGSLLGTSHAFFSFELLDREWIFRFWRGKIRNFSFYTKPGDNFALIGRNFSRNLLWIHFSTLNRNFWGR